MGNESARRLRKTARKSRRNQKGGFENKEWEQTAREYCKDRGLKEKDEDFPYCLSWAYEQEGLREAREAREAKEAAKAKEPKEEVPESP